MKKLNLFSMMCLMALPLITGCGKENESNGNDNPQPQKHNVELVYGTNHNTQWQNITLDTLNKYNSDPTVDSIFMILEHANQYCTMDTYGYKTLASYLRERHNVNPNKVFGKGDILLRRDAVEGHPEIVRFFADTLKHNVIYHDITKSK